MLSYVPSCAIVSGSIKPLDTQAKSFIEQACGCVNGQCSCQDVACRHKLPEIATCVCVCVCYTGARFHKRYY